MKNRRVITGIDKLGKSVFLADGPAPRAKEFETIPGFASALVWSTDGVPGVGPGDVPDPTLSVTSFVPGPGGTRLMTVTFTPDSDNARPDFDPAAAGAEIARENPGIAETFEMDNPGMHTTNTLDYCVVLDGEIWLELDDGKEVHLQQQDVVIQNGTRHAWRNKGSKPATMLFVFIGAARRA